ncbi:MAG: DUF3047 domain-containing protein [Candidatus Omnitrophica bacterium]|nr:DUF3047 domain-containing protein [Candidatus Omnitrophota bacterium]
MKKKLFSLATALLIICIAVILSWLLYIGKKSAAPKVSEMTKAAQSAIPRFKIERIKLFPFTDNSALKEWEEKVFKGRVAYGVEKEDTFSYVHARSQSAASALFYKIKLDTRRMRPVLRWKWKVGKFPEKKSPENLESEVEHDFAGRVYVVFPTLFLLDSHVLEYIWAEKLPVGSMGTSPYSKNIKLMVLESGIPEDGGFISEERDIVADYAKAFGNPPRLNAGAIAFMTNAEHTASSADGMYDEIEVGYKEE